jgi:hypothetical protein
VCLRGVRSNSISAVGDSSRIQSEALYRYVDQRAALGLTHVQSLGCGRSLAVEGVNDALNIHLDRRCSV